MGPTCQWHGSRWTKSTEPLDRGWAGLAHPRMRGADAAPMWLTRARHGGYGAEVEGDMAPTTAANDNGGERLWTGRQRRYSGRRRGWVVRLRSWG